MKIKQVTFGRTVSKNYQSSKAEVTIELEEGDTYEGALANARALVARAHGEAPTKEQVDQAREIIALDSVLNK